MTKCPNCGTENAEGSNFCIACGADLTPTATDQRVRTDSVSSPSVSSPPNPPASTPLSSASVDMPPEYLGSAPPPPPPPPVYTPPVYSPPPPNYTTPAATVVMPGRKERSLALVLEILGGILGLPGIGWIYAGQMTTGVVLLVVMIAINLIGIFIAFFTLFVSCVCSVPLNLIVAGISSYLLYNHTKQHPEVFGS